MGISTAVVRAVSITSAANQDFTTADFGGGTPKAVIAIFNDGLTDGTAADHCRMSIGFATGTTNRGNVDHNAEHGQTETDNAGSVNPASLLRADVHGKESTVVAEADFVAFITNGVRINWSTAPPSAFLCTFILLGGSDLSAHCGVTALGDIDEQTIDDTAPGFQPDVILAVSQDKLGTDNPAPSFGCFWDNADTFVYRSSDFYRKKGVATSDVSNDLSTLGIVAPKFRTDLHDWYLTILDLDSNGFSTKNFSGGCNSSSLVYLALAFGGSESVHLGTYTTPTSDGEDAETGPGFKPQLVIMGVNGAEAVDTHYDDNRGGTNGISVFTPDAEFCNTTSSEDLVTTTNDQSLSDNLALNVPDDDGTAETTASFVSMDTNGFTLDYSASPTTAKVYWMLSIEEEAAGGVATVDNLFINQAVNRAATY